MADVPVVQRVDPVGGALAQQAGAQVDVPKTALSTVIDRRDVVPVVFVPGGDLAAGSISVAVSNLGRLAGSDLRRTLRADDFVAEMDKARAEVQQVFDLDRSVSISAAGVSLGLSVAYVLWMVRGGVLVGSYLSALPAWKMLDPLPVLSQGNGDMPEDDDALDAEADRPADPLRGIG